MNNVINQQFDSISSFYKYICDTPINSTFRWHSLSSTNGNYDFTKTVSFEQAVDLMKYGWTDMAEKMTQKLKATPDMELIHQMRTIVSVAGFQPIVPLYLAGVPQNMVSKKMVPVKQKVLNITKSVDYNGGVSADTIIEESIKAMQIIKKLESQGYRVNLNIAIGSVTTNKTLVCKIRIKNASEKLNVSKLAFPLAHPSMLRRLFLRWIEVHPEVTDAFLRGYGRAATYEQLKEAFPDDIVLPAIFKGEINDISDVRNIRAGY